MIVVENDTIELIAGGLAGLHLDWAVAKALKHTVAVGQAPGGKSLAVLIDSAGVWKLFNPTGDDVFVTEIAKKMNVEIRTFKSCDPKQQFKASVKSDLGTVSCLGDTPSEAGLRAVVIAQLPGNFGNTVNVPTLFFHKKEYLHIKALPTEGQATRSQIAA